MSYANYCAACHGTNRQGAPNFGPALKPDALARLTDSQVRDTITDGRPNTLMKGFSGRLSQSEIDDLVKYLKYSQQ